ncbi:hypothetical protein SAMN05660748_3726 [Blastococcus aggregatus]|uniref:Uncharacterized protein n=1 Tax=Blastococcus aggregatus TaxID=38502 RepID=A0A285VBF5_9ACTN|nr:hypothetical protein [Blastococcus aggregatus]MBY3554065.1 hypothetical protein [Modestobacter lapidis]SOC51445.1 hypothetical protein SAMN05660748_3726 [Blastococcus aggregatus]
MTILAVEEVGRALFAAPACFRPFIAVCVFAWLRLGGSPRIQYGTPVSRPARRTTARP